MSPVIGRLLRSNHLHRCEPQRPVSLPLALDALVEEPFLRSWGIDASVGTFTVHQRKDLERGLHQMRMVTKGPLLPS